MKKYLTFLIVLFFSVSIFAKDGSIKKIRMNKRPPQLVFDIDGVSSPNFTSTYDEYNRILFIQVKNAKMKTKINPRQLYGKYVEKIDYVDYGKDSGFFIKLKKDANHKVKKLRRPARIVVDLKPDKYKKEFTIAIDAGHGGKDPGAVGFKKYYEKNLTLSVAKKLRDKLSKDFNVIMTRDTDKFIKLSERSKIANRANADLFVSIHANAARNSKSNGVEIFYFSKKSSPYAEKIAAFENSFGKKYGEQTDDIAQIMGELSYNKNMEKSMSLAEPTNNKLAERLNMNNRGIFGANFAVLRGFNGPGILVEIGFISNRADLNKMLKNVNQNVMAEEIARNIRNYFY